MGTSPKQILNRLSLAALGFMVIACQPGSRFHAPVVAAQVKTDTPAIEEELIPTVTDTDSDGPVIKNGVTYEAPPKKIINPQAEIILGQLKMENTKIVYDPATRQLSVKGLARVSDEKKVEIGSAEFSLAGTHTDDESKILLKSTTNAKSDSSLAPIVRAKVTCLAINKQGNTDCSQAVVDFFVAYRKKIYTQQMELAPKVTTPEVAPTPPSAPAPQPVTTTPGSNEVDQDPKTDDLQSEGEEQSLNGRYQGHAETEDLKKVFEDDQATDPVIVVAQPDKTTETPQAEEDKKPDVSPQTPSAPTLPPTPTPKPTPKPPTTVQPSPTPTPAKNEDKPLTKDLQQTSTGDIRQINQAIGFPDQGNLRNATSLLTKQQTLSAQAFFEVVAPERNRHFATYEMAEMISRLGQTLNEIYSHKLYLGNISAQNGGKLKPHLSHQIGVDADIAYPTTKENVKFPVVVQMSTRHFDPSSFSVGKTYELLKFAFSQRDIKIDRVFIDRTIKKSLCDYAKSQNEFSSKDKNVVNTLFNSIDHVEGHGDHFHIRLKCSAYDPACRHKNYTVNQGCG